MEEILNNESEQQIGDNTPYIEAIKEMKKNSVSKDAYEKLQKENKQLLSSLINGNQIDLQPTQEKAPVDIDALRKELFNKDAEYSNLEFATKALELRDAVIEAGEPDPFLPIGNQISPTDEDVNKANKVAEALKSCIDYADGNSEIFTQELMRITVDTAPRKFKR